MTTAPLVLRTLAKNRDERWESYVRRHPGGTVYHTLGWRRIIERAFRREAHYFYVEWGDVITGVLHAERVAGHLDARLEVCRGGHLLQLWRGSLTGGLAPILAKLPRS